MLNEVEKMNGAWSVDYIFTIPINTLSVGIGAVLGDYVYTNRRLRHR